MRLAHRRVRTDGRGEACPRDGRLTPADASSRRHRTAGPQARAPGASMSAQLAQGRRPMHLGGRSRLSRDGPEVGLRR